MEVRSNQYEMPNGVLIRGFFGNDKNKLTLN